VLGSAAGAAPSVYSESVWFKTTKAGGALMTFGNSSTGANKSQDRTVYLTSSGQLDFGVWTGKTTVIQSPTAYNDGNWHFVVATQGSDGMHLYVDGTQVASGSSANAQSYTGYWQLGLAVNGGWPNRTTSGFAGSISDAAMWNRTELTASQVNTLFTAG
jgi:hypothetical protein